MANAVNTVVNVPTPLVALFVMEVYFRYMFSLLGGG